MILSPNLSVCDTILDSLKLILKYFDQTILDNLQPATHTNIDLQRSVYYFYIFENNMNHTTWLMSLTHLWSANLSLSLDYRIKIYGKA